MKYRQTGKITGTLLCAALLLAGCSQEQLYTGSSMADEDIKVYAIVAKAEGNPYNELMCEGYAQVIEEAGGNCVISYPEEATAEAQIEVIDDLISQGVDSITVAANDADALSDILTEAKEMGIHVTTVDSDVNSDDREIFVNQVAAEEIAALLVDAVYDITGGEGQWAILSASSQATNQNAWIRAMQEVLEDEKYQDLRLVDIVYGNDDEELSAELTEELLEEYPDLKVICAPTSAGIPAVAQVLSAHTESDVKVTGLGLPSDMAEYVLSDDPVCPCLFLWNPIELGQTAAYVSIALAEEKITGKKGETFTAGELGNFQVKENDSGGTEVIVNSVITFDSTNIEEWKELF